MIDLESLLFDNVTIHPVVETIRQLRSTSKRTDKTDILKRALSSKHADQFFQLLKWCYQYDKVFFLNQIPNCQSHPTKSHDQWYEQFVVLANALVNREVTGHAALHAVVKYAETYCDKLLWDEVVSHVLRKDIRAGITEKTVNKVVGTSSPHHILTFECQLAHPAKLHESKMVGWKFLQPKYDGVRGLLFVGKGPSYMLSRNGKHLDNFPHICEWFDNHVRPHLSEPTVFDGEIIAANFHSLMSQLNRKEEIDTSDAKFAVFDTVPVDKFELGVHAVPLSSRHEQLRQIIDKARETDDSDVMCVWIPQTVKVDLTQDYSVVGPYMAKCVEEGYEGIMVKDVGSPYQCKRSDAWLKIKPSLTVDLEIIDVEEGTGKNEGLLGAFVCAGDVDGLPIKVNVGTGITDEQRSQFWDQRNVLIGNTIEIHCDMVTESKDRPGEYSLRFPSFMGIRWDK